jgi:hypothetical protein
MNCDHGDLKYTCTMVLTSNICTIYSPCIVNLTPICEALSYILQATDIAVMFGVHMHLFVFNLGHSSLTWKQLLFS